MLLYYVVNNPLIYVDPLGKYYILADIKNNVLTSYRLVEEDVVGELLKSLATALDFAPLTTLFYISEKLTGVVGGTGAMKIEAATIMSDAKTFYEFMSGKKIKLGNIVEHVTHNTIDGSAVNKAVGKLDSFKASRVGTVATVVYATYNFLSSLIDYMERQTSDFPMLDFAYAMGIGEGTYTQLLELEEKIGIIEAFIADHPEYFNEYFITVMCGNNRSDANKKMPPREIEMSTQWLLGYVAQQGEVDYETFLSNNVYIASLFKYVGGDKTRFYNYLNNTIAIELEFEYWSYEPEFLEARQKKIEEFEGKTDRDTVLDARKEMLKKLENLLK